MSELSEAWAEYSATRPGAPHGWNPPDIFAAGFAAGLAGKPVPRSFTASHDVRSSGWYGGKE
jgi:hypothetical protein